MHNPTKREIREHQEFLLHHLKTQDAIESAQRYCSWAMRDAVRVAKVRGRIDPKHLFSSDPDLRRMLETKDEETGYGIVGHITDDEKHRTWHVLVNLEQRRRRLVRVR